MDWENDILQRRQKAGKGNFADDSQSSTTIEAASFKKLAFKHDSLQKVAWLSICSSVCLSVRCLSFCIILSVPCLLVYLSLGLPVCSSVLYLPGCLFVLSFPLSLVCRTLVVSFLSFLCLCVCSSVRLSPVFSLFSPRLAYLLVYSSTRLLTSLFLFVCPSVCQRVCLLYFVCLQAWGASRCVSKDDWMEWLRRLSVELLKESPSPSLRSCWATAQSYPPLARLV